MIKVLSVNVGAVQAMEIAGRRVMTGMHKRPVSGPVACRALGLTGDEQADLTVHGGLSKAVYAYPSEHFAFWRTVRAQARVGALEDLMATAQERGHEHNVPMILIEECWHVMCTRAERGES